VHDMLETSYFDAGIALAVRDCGPLRVPGASGNTPGLRFVMFLMSH